MKFIYRYKFLLTFLVFILLFAAAQVILYLTEEDLIYERQVRQVEERLNERVQNMEAWLLDSAAISPFLYQTYSWDHFLAVYRQDFNLLMYRADSLIFWNDNQVLPVDRAGAYEDGKHLLRLPNGYYLLEKNSTLLDSIYILGLLPISYQYPINNEYLSGNFANDLGIPPEFRLVADSISPYPVSIGDGPPLFYLQRSQVSAYGEGLPLNPWLRSAYYVTNILAGLTLILLLYLLSVSLGKRTHSFIGFFAFTAGLVLLRFLNIFYDFPGVLRQAIIFDPHYFASSAWFPSLGDLLINLALLFFISLYFINHISFRQILEKRPIRIGLFGFLTSFVVLALTRLSVYAFRSLVIDSNISFDINYFLNLDLFSLLGFLCIGLILINYYLISRKMVYSLLEQRPGGARLLTSLLSGILLFGLIQILINHRNVNYQIYTWGLVMLVLAWWSHSRSYTHYSLPNILLWLSVFSIFSSGLLIKANAQKLNDNQKLYALKVANDRDPVAEYLFDDMSDRIRQDNFIRRFFSYTIPGEGQTTDRLKQLYFGGYFSRYEVTVNYFNRSGRPLSEAGETQAFNEWMSQIRQAEETEYKDLYFLSGASEKAYYLAHLRIPYARNSLGHLFIKLVPRILSENSLYPELLLEEKLKKPEDFENLEYAVYYKNELVDKEGDYGYPYYDNFFLEQGKEFKEISSGSYTHLIYQPDPQKKVIISRKDEKWIKPISQFSYFFIFFLFLVMVYLLIHNIFTFFWGQQPWKRLFQSSLRNRIQFAVVSIVLFSFIALGIVTILYFSQQYNTYHQQRLLRKLQSIMTSMEYLLEEEGELSSLANRVDKSWEPAIASFSDIHSMDINIYDLKGELLLSSQPSIFDKGLVSDRMEPRAFYKMSCDKETQYIQYEQIGKLNYLSVYAPLLDGDGLEIGYLNLPYFAKEKNLKNEIASFMVTLINVYVFLLVGAGIIALLISNSITGSLAKIRSKFRQVKLRGNNEPITWDSQDEIGLLVAEYNHMIAELEHSATLLAQSERESAWREMARQVAHEIKNPLTPMRLSIQHLQRAMASGDQDVEALSQRVTRTLLEQIDNLSYIASEFSNFAKMPKARHEKISLNEVLLSVVNLFRDHEHIQLEVDICEEEVIIMADKNQMVRVFNNILKNAFQAIPKDRKGLVSVKMKAYSQNASVIISDNGIGIPESQKEQVFVPNFTTKSSGMGLGLAMSRNIIDSIGGMIWFESEEDKGTEFHLEFPKVIEASYST